MLVPSIDLMDGRAVQLVGGKDKALDAGDPWPFARKFGLCGEVAVVDLDAALGRGDNRALIEKVCGQIRCRVGGGIRDLLTARRMLDAGARKIVLGTAAVPELLAQLPKDRLVAALDAVDGEVVVDGWRTKTGARIADKMLALRELVGGFLVTFVEREGRLGGTAMERVAELKQAAGACRLTIAGGVTSCEEIAALDRMGCDAQVGMALYTGRIGLAEAFCAPLRADREDGLWPTVVVDEHGRALGQVWSSAQSVREAIETGSGVYHSRRRGLWRKGETSGATQKLLAIDADCDRDALRFTVAQSGPGFCHLGSASCWGPLGGLGSLSRVLAERAASAPSGSYTARLCADPALLRAKLLEEAGELCDADGKDAVAGEAADVIYFALVAAARAGVSLAEVERILDQRSLQVTRRAGDAKAAAPRGAK